MNSPRPAKINPANNRIRKDAGRPARGPGGLLGGPGGSSTPIPVDLRGGPPMRAEEVCVSNSSSQCRNSYGILKCYRRRRSASSATCIASEQAEDCFDGDPRGNGALGSVSRRNKFPATHSFNGALVQAKPNAFDDANILRTAISAYENRQRHRSLHFAVPRFVGIRRIWAIRAPRRHEPWHVRALPCAIAAWPHSTITKSIAIFRPDAMSFPGAWRRRIIWHPG